MRVWSWFELELKYSEKWLCQILSQNGSGLDWRAPPNTLQTGGTVPRSRILRQNFSQCHHVNHIIQMAVHRGGGWTSCAVAHRRRVSKTTCSEIGAVLRVSCTLGHGNEFKSNASLSCFLFLWKSLHVMSVMSSYLQSKSLLWLVERLGLDTQC